MVETEKRARHGRCMRASRAFPISQIDPLSSPLLSLLLGIPPALLSSGKKEERQRNPEEEEEESV